MIVCKRDIQSEGERDKEDQRRSTAENQSKNCSHHRVEIELKEIKEDNDLLVTYNDKKKKGKKKELWWTIRLEG